MIRINMAEAWATGDISSLKGLRVLVIVPELQLQDFDWPRRVMKHIAENGLEDCRIVCIGPYEFWIQPPDDFE